MACRSSVDFLKRSAMKSYLVVASLLLVLASFPNLANADKSSKLPFKPVSYKVPSSHKNKTLAEIGRIVSIQEVNYRDEINKEFQTENYKEEGLKGLDPDFLSRHLYRYRIIPSAEYRTSMALRVKPSFRVRFIDGSIATVYPHRVYFRPKDGEPYMCWLDDLRKEKQNKAEKPTPHR